MKVYTEVNYIWKDNKLVQTDSKSFDYEGEVDLCHWYHRHSTTVSIPTPTITVPNITIPKITIPSVPDIIDAYKGSDIDKGLTTGQKAGGAALEKIKKDNPNPNLNVQTPDQLYNKGRDLLHDAATNVKKVWDRNRPSYGGNDEEYTNNPTSKPIWEDNMASSRSGYSTLRGEGSSVASNKLRREIPVLKTLSGNAKPKA